MLVSLFSIILLVGFCCNSFSFKTCGARMFLRVGTTHTKIRPVGTRRLFPRSKLPVRFSFIRPLASNGEEAGKTDVGVSGDEGAVSAGGTELEDPTTAHSLSAFQRLVSSFGEGARTLVPSPMKQKRKRDKNAKAMEAPLLGTVLDDEKLDRFFTAETDGDEMSAEEKRRREQNKVVRAFHSNRTGPIGVGLIQSPITRLDPATGAIVYGDYSAQKGIEAEQQRLIQEAAEEELRILEREEVFDQLGAAAARTVIADRNGGIMPELVDYKLTEPYLGTVDRRGREVESYVDPASRLDEFDEFGVPIRDPVEARNRRRNRERERSSRDASLAEGGKLLEVPDVDPNELQTLEAFQTDAAFYAGGKVEHRDPRDRVVSDEPDPNYLENLTHENEENIHWPLHPRKVRVQITSMVTNSSTNCTALDYVQKVYDFLKNATDNDPRIDYQIQVIMLEGEAYPGMEDVIQMWLESYNVYHLIDGLAMKDAWGCIMPHIILGKKNLQAILDQVKWALLEDSLEGPLLSPKMRAIRLQGGKENFVRGYNTQESTFEHSVVSDT